jgi:hypothetical protein
LQRRGIIVIKSKWSTTHIIHNKHLCFK